jgi:hypothetical protein
MIRATREELLELVEQACRECERLSASGSRNGKQLRWLVGKARDECCEGRRILNADTYQALSDLLTCWENLKDLSVRVRRRSSGVTKFDVEAARSTLQRRVAELRALASAKVAGERR